MTSGIYKITNKITNDFYIGSSKNIENRWRTHLYSFKNNDKKRTNLNLLSEVNKYGINNFMFEILEVCAEEKLIEREQYFYELLKPKYNSIQPNENPMLNNEIKLKHKKILKEYWDNWDNTEYIASYEQIENLKKVSIKTRYNKKKIIAINIITGEEKEFESMYLAEKELGIKRSSISQILNKNHTRKRSKNYTFKIKE